MAFVFLPYNPLLPRINLSLERVAPHSGDDDRTDLHRVAYQAHKYSVLVPKESMLILSTLQAQSQLS
jgi:hypothetical protein